MARNDTPEAKLADHCTDTRDLTESGGTPTEKVEIGRRAVTISVRFSAEEIEALRAHADAASQKLTAFIRAAALEADRPIDRDALASLAADCAAQIHELRRAVS